MREVKFRLYSKEEKEMFYPEHIEKIDFYNKFARVEGKGFYGYFDFSEDESVLMEYTGLKDKNGKEIYEGDIIIHKNPKPFRDLIYEIVFLKGGFAIKNNDYIKDLSEFLKESSKAEVIGNKYKNPELLSENYRVFV